MEWRLKRTGSAAPMWALYDEPNRHWSWTSDVTKAFVAHNRYIVEAMQRRAPDSFRYGAEIEFTNGQVTAERPAERPATVRKRTLKREGAPC